MEFCNIKNPPEYIVDVERWTRETYADGEQMAVVVEQLLNNTFYNKSVQEQHEKPIRVILPASGWSDTAPYSQKIAVMGVKLTDHPLVSPCTPKDMDPSVVKNYRKMAALITDGETEDGFITFYCGEKRPTIDFEVYLRGVSANG